MANNNKGEKKINIKDRKLNGKLLLWMSAFTTKKE